LKESNFEGVMIDTCDNCSGVWLDPGEFGQLVQKEGKGGWFSRFWNAQD
jgi:Zn-finger nucleic acid-binding protein